jgi:broad specificity phosphatase PhoE
MNDLRKVLGDISQLTSEIETHYPELYHFLDENPLTLPANNLPHVNKEDLKDYLESLKQLIKHHLETHKKNG